MLQQIGSIGVVPLKVTVHEDQVMYHTRWVLLDVRRVFVEFDHIEGGYDFTQHSSVYKKGYRNPKKVSPFYNT